MTILIELLMPKRYAARGRRTFSFADGSTHLPIERGIGVEEWTIEEGAGNVVGT